MRCLNKVTLIGRVGQDPEVRYTQKGDAILSFSLATSEKYNDQETTQWHRVSVFGKMASALQDYITKGKPLYVEGQLVYEEWTDKDGNKRNTPRIKVGFGGNVILLGDSGGERAARKPKADGEPLSGSGTPVPSDDDIPF